MGVTHGKKKEHQHFPHTREAHPSQPASMIQTHQNEQIRLPEFQAPPSQLLSEEESINLIKPHKPLSPLTASRSHKELQKELQMTHKRRVAQDEKTELQRVLEKRKWEQRTKARRDQEEAKRNASPLHQELLKRKKRLENLEREEKEKQEEPEFLQVKERLRRTAEPDDAEKDV
ncbi:actin-associated protein FAM107A [Melanotaenia boesemani]|uniref:actin-associated protein FAM107A n=1 Tax=Melanotaenia boesemani TaxID=1250792 RepID=UPI001C04D8B8|nr:actin-associated protein FAM107A [Melanotaenia boesemani]